jgi:hypothetical protein
VVELWRNPNSRDIRFNLGHLSLTTRGVSHCDLTIYIKNYLKAKEEELWKLKYYFTTKKYNLQKKNPLKETKILQDIIKTL